MEFYLKMNPLMSKPGLNIPGLEKEEATLSHPCKHKCGRYRKQTLQNYVMNSDDIYTLKTDTTGV